VTTQGTSASAASKALARSLVSEDAVRRMVQEVRKFIERELINEGVKAS
jgi:hypothetical protein